MTDLANAIYDQLVALKIDPCKLLYFTSDGAASMIGKQNGCGAHLRRMCNPFMLQMHCIAHRLALAGIDTAEKRENLERYERALRKIHSFFSNSSTRHEELRELQKSLNVPELTPYRPAPTRWLSFHKAVSVMLQTYPAVLSYFRRSLQKSGKDKLSKEQKQDVQDIVHAISEVSFVAWSYFLDDVLGKLAGVCERFQKTDVEFGSAMTDITTVKQTIEDTYWERTRKVKVMQDAVEVEQDRKVFPRAPERLESFYKSVLNSMADHRAIMLPSTEPQVPGESGLLSVEHLDAQLHVGYVEGTTRMLDPIHYSEEHGRRYLYEVRKSIELCARSFVNALNERFPDEDMLNTKAMIMFNLTELAKRMDDRDLMEE